MKLSPTKTLTLVTPLFLLVACGSGADDASMAAKEAAAAPAEEMADATEAAAAESMDAMPAADDMESAAESMVDDMESAAESMADDAAAAVETMAEETMSDGGAEASSAAAGSACELAIEVGDALKFSTNSLSVLSSCSEVTLTLTHTGNLPATAMGHNWVLMPAGAVTDIATAGMGAGAAANYVPEDDRIVAATNIIGGGESTSVTFSLSDLEAGTDYAYVCTFPGHWSVMRGTFTIES
ncbi:MAG: azurin [Pseudomonadota bacterium]